MCGITAATPENKFMWMYIYMMLLRGPLQFFTWSFCETVDKMKSSSVAVCVFFSLLVTSSLAVIPTVWSDYIATVCRTFEVSPTSSVVQSQVQICATTTGVQNPLLHLMPHIIIWAPGEQFPHLFPNGLKCPKCHNENADESSPLCAVGWRDGRGPARSEPRKIHGTDGVVLLVGRVYKCTKQGHEILSYNAGLLQQIPTAYLVPFQLWHRTGFTPDLMMLIESLVTAGVSLSGIRDMLFRKRCLHYNTVKSRFSTLRNMLLPHDISQVPFPTFDEWSAYFPSLVPSRHAISACFLASFWKKAHLYKLHMQRVSTDNQDGWLSCDHTFKSAGEYLI